MAREGGAEPDPDLVRRGAFSDPNKRGVGQTFVTPLYSPSVKTGDAYGRHATPRF